MSMCKNGCTWANVQLVCGLWSGGGRGGSILCTYSVEYYSWSHELYVGGIWNWSGFRRRGILKGPYIVVVGVTPATMC